MSDRDRLQRAFEETFDMNTTPGFRQAVISRAVTARQGRPPASRFTFALGAAAAVVLIAGLVALLHMPAQRPAPVVRPTPSASPVGKLFTAKQLNDLAAVVYPKDPRYAYYVTCDGGGNQAACPFTARLQAQLSLLKTTACFGCQAPSTTRVVTPTLTDEVKVVEFNGTIEYDLVVIADHGRLLVDDILWACPNSSASRVSVYSMHLTGGPAGQMPYGLQPVPACA